MLGYELKRGYRLQVASYGLRNRYKLRVTSLLGYLGYLVTLAKAGPPTEALRKIDIRSAKQIVLLERIHYFQGC